MLEQEAEALELFLGGEARIMDALLPQSQEEGLQHREERRWGVCWGLPLSVVLNQTPSFPPIPETNWPTSPRNHRKNAMLRVKKRGQSRDTLLELLKEREMGKETHTHTLNSIWTLFYNNLRYQGFPLLSAS